MREIPLRQSGRVRKSSKGRRGSEWAAIEATHPSQLNLRKHAFCAGMAGVSHKGPRAMRFSDPVAGRCRPRVDMLVNGSTSQLDLKATVLTSKPSPDLHALDPIRHWIPEGGT